jgi:hypothetical protein
MKDKLLTIILAALLFFGAAAVWAVPRYLEIAAPGDKTMTYAAAVAVQGKALTGAVDKVLIGQVKVGIEPDRSFTGEAALSIGKNAVKFTALDGAGRPLAVVTGRVLRLATFKDIEPGYWARSPVEELATLGIITGYTDGAFRPDGPISRAEFATILAKLQGNGSKEGKTAAYPDVPDDYWAASHIAAAAGRGWITGYPDGNFRPTFDINRVEAIAIVARFAGLTVSPSEPVISHYNDILPQHWAVKLIESARQAGYLDHIQGMLFEPEKVLTRGEACYILSRTAFVKKHNDRLIDFEQGY